MIPTNRQQGKGLLPSLARSCTHSHRSAGLAAQVFGVCLLAAIPLRWVDVDGAELEPLGGEFVERVDDAKGRFVAFVGWGG